MAKFPPYKCIDLAKNAQYLLPYSRYKPLPLLATSATLTAKAFQTKAYNLKIMQMQDKSAKSLQL